MFTYLCVCVFVCLLAFHRSSHLSFDVDYLLMCMDQNPEFQQEKELETRKWREDIMEYATECLNIMRGFIPPHVFDASAAHLEKEGMSKDLVKRITTKKCLWLIRCSSHDIGKMHIAELMGRFNPEAQGLDIVETAALYAIIPSKFANDDANGSKGE
jgi:hypothetical protein